MTSLTQSYYAGPTNIQLTEQTIGSQLDDTVAKYPDNEALVACHQNIRWSYKELLEQVENLAAGLLHTGIKKGDRVGIWGPNGFEWAVTQFATAKIGAVLVCINPAYRVYELEYALNKVECSAIVSAESFKSSHYLKMLQSLAPELEHCEPGQLKAEKLPHLTTVIRMGDEKTPGMLNFAEVCQLGTEEDRQQMHAIKDTLKAEDPINIQFTSGTTGNPKGATLSHRNILNNGKIVADGMLFTDQDRLCIPVPLYHCFGLVMSNLACMSHGATMVYPSDAFDPLATLKAVQEERCTALHGVPTMFIAELEHPQFSEFDLSTLRTGCMAGAPCPISVMRQVLEQMHMSDVLIAYGQTELSPVNCMTAADDPIEKRVGTVGQPGPQLKVKITDENNEIVAVGERGEVCTQGYSVMLGYWNDAEKTEETIDADGWLHSGDIGIMDEEGFVQIVGRIKDMVCRGGENVYPREVEEFLYTHPDIQDVQVIGVPDQKMGEEVCAWIKLQDGAALTEDEVKAYCKDKIAHFKVPRYIRFVDDYPMTVTGKIQKFKMREMMEQELASA